MRNFGKSKKLFQKALRLIPGGVNSPVRAFRAVGGNPLFIEKAKGSKIYDVDGNSYIDYVLSWGPMILGHVHPAVARALKNAVSKGTSFGAPTALEVELAELVLKIYPSMDKVRMVNSGTEATMCAIRAARGFTGRDKIIKFEGCYHGHADGLLVKAGSGAATFGLPDSPGVPKSYARNTLTLPYNDICCLKKYDREGMAFNRLRNCRTCCGQYRLRAAETGFPRNTPEIDQKTRHCSHIRRGHDRFQGLLWRSTGVLRDQA